MTHPEFLRAFALAECTEVGDDDAARLLAAASRIEELERAQTGFRLALADVAVQADRYEREEIGGQELADTVGFTARQALSEPSPAAPAKQTGAARYLEG
jgi:hypothetical protein